MTEAEVLSGTTNIETGLKGQAPVPIGEFTPSAMATNPAAFDQIQRVAKMFAASSWIPPHYKANFADVVVAVSMACTLDVNPVMFLQRTFPVHGRIGFEGQLAIALINTSGIFQHSLRFDTEGVGEKMKVTAWNTFKDGTRAEASIDMQTLKEWGKLGHFMLKGNDPGQKLSYMAGLLFARKHCPERLLGMKSEEELAIDVTGSSRATALNKKLGLKKD
jgi:hypothetical protein